MYLVLCGASAYLKEVAPSGLAALNFSECTNASSDQMPICINCCQATKNTHIPKYTHTYICI